MRFYHNRINHSFLLTFFYITQAGLPALSINDLPGIQVRDRAKLFGGNYLHLRLFVEKRLHDAGAEGGSAIKDIN